MNKTKIAINCLLLFLMTALIIPMSVSVKPVSAQAQTGPAADTLVYRSVPVDLAAQALAAGDIDMYIFGLRPVNAEPLKTNPNIDLINAPVGTVSIAMNPAPMPAGRLNPLSIKEVRLAMNYLMDRDYTVTQTYKGFAAPMVTFLSSYDPDFVTIYDLIAKYDFKYDPSVANSIVTAAMTKAGATKTEGKWFYQGNPVSLKFIIRVEDERREIGDTFASSLENLGFTIERIYMPFGQAIPIIYGTDPIEHQWDFYTEGWGKGAVDKYDSSAIVQYGATWYGYMPGWAEPGFWQYENATIDDICTKVFQGQYKSRAERDNLYRQGTEMIIQEATRVWVVTRLEIHPVRTEVVGITADLGTGLRSFTNAREVNVPGRTPNTVNVGHLWVHTDGSAWNPMAGHQDVYSIDQWRVVSDFFTWRHPFSGEPMPVRWSYKVTTAGPTGTMSVPANAVLWNSTEKKWKEVGTGVTAVSMVAFDVSKYIGTKWHNNQTITWADLLFNIQQLYELVNNSDKSTIEGATAAKLETVLGPFKGFQIEGNTWKVYMDFWHFDENYIAAYADVSGGDPPCGHYPWEILASMDKVVFEDKAAMYSESAAEAFGVPWFSVNLPAHAGLVDVALDRVSLSDYESIFTVNGVSYATAEELAQRVAADHAWYAEKGNIVISDGPFYMNKFDAAANYAEYKAFRDPSYPFSKGKWVYGKPTAPEITKVGIPTVVPGGAATFIVDVDGLPPLGMKYLIRDPVTANVLKTGTAESLTTSRFRISLASDFTKSLQPGLYELTIAAYSEQVAVVAATKEFFDVFNTLPLEDAFKNATQTATDQLQAAFANSTATLERTFANSTATLERTFASQSATMQAAFAESIKTLSSTYADANAALGKTFNAALNSSATTYSTALSSATTTLTEAVSDLDTALTQLGTSLSSQYSTSTNEIKQSVDSLAATQNMLMWIGIVAIVLAVISLALIAVILMRRK